MFQLVTSMQMVKVRSILWSAGGIAAAGAVAAIVAVVVVPVRSSDETASQISHPSASAQTGQRPTTLPLESFETAWQIPLRRPLVDTPASVASDNAVAPASAVPAVRLIGTIVDGQHARGIFITGLSTVEMKSVGDTVGAAKILAIDDNSATLSSNTGTITLQREKRPFDPSGESYTPAVPAGVPASDSKDASE